jgi:hypothetical protein
MLTGIVRISTMAVIALSFVTRVQADSIIYDQGPATGTVVNSYQNRTDAQNFADNFAVTNDDVLTGYHLFGGYSVAGTFHLKLFADAAGIPGANALYSLDIAPTSVVNTGGTVGDFSIYDYSFNFAATPVSVAANTKYWIGVSGNNFDPGQIVLFPGPDDGQLAVYNGTSFQSVRSAGDQAYQLVGHAASEVVAPLPSSGWGIMVLLSGFILIRISRKGNHSITKA